MKVTDLPVRFTAEKHLVPLWRANEIYDDTLLFVGEEGESTLAFLPTGKIIVRSYTLDTVYEEGKDYTVHGKIVRRVKGSAMPFIKEEDYFRSTPAEVGIGVDNAYAEIPLNGQYYLAYGEKDTFTAKEVAVSYVTEENDFSFVPQASEKLAPLKERFKKQGGGAVLFYGDSITVGCNASATEYGGELPPYTPSWAQLTGTYLAKACGVRLETVNKAVGGWRAADGIREMEERVLSRSYDLLVLAFGMNDGLTEHDVWEKEMRTLIEAFLDRNPNGFVLLVSTMFPNRQSNWRIKQVGQEEILAKLAAEYERVGLARGSSAFSALEATGKRTRDFLANNINHPNDFGVRLYAEVILVVLVGEESLKEAIRL